MRNSLVNSWSKNALRLAIAVSLASPLAPIPMVYAQDQEQLINEIVVSFIRRSSRDAIEIKRSNTGVMDAISAEDFGR